MTKYKCHNCGRKVTTTLYYETWKCTGCGEEMVEYRE